MELPDVRSCANLLNICLVGLLISLSAVSTKASAKGFYSAIDIGQSHHEEYNCHLIPPGVSCSTDSSAERLGIGYMFSRNFGMEANYGNMGKIRWADTNSILGGPGEGTITALQLGVVVAVPLTEALSIVGRVGTARTTVTVFSSLMSSGPSYGLGAQYDISPRYAFRVQYEEFTVLGIGDTVFSLTSAGIVLKF